MKKARIIKIISNSYTVLDENNEKIQCLAMGKVRLQVVPTVGDFVLIEQLDDKMVIQKVLERKNYIIRPPMANIDQGLIVMSAIEPDFSVTLVNRLSFLIEHAGIKPVIVVTKLDLVSDEKIQHISSLYENTGIDVVLVRKETVNEQFNELCNNKISFLTGQSGVGKSSLFNMLDADFSLKTQEISKALGRGKHTTRHVELHEVCGGWIADTPGFSSLDFSKMSIEDVKNSVVEFQTLSPCKFRNCIHQHEPGCVVKEALEQNKIQRHRYESYLEIVVAIQEGKVKTL